MTTSIARSPVLWIGLVIGLVIAASGLVGGESILAATISLVVVLGFVVLMALLQGRSETASSLAGRPADERWEHISLEASAYAFAVSALATIGALAITQATGGAWGPYALVAGVMGLAYLGSLAVVRARH